MTEILIIRGAPGVGKSSIGKHLTQYFKDGITIEIDEVRRMINSVTWKNTEEHLNAIEATGALVLAYLDLQYCPIIILDTLSEGTIRIILNKFPTNLTYKTISLIATDEKIRERIEKRNEGFMDYEISLKVNSSILQEKIENNILVDTSELSIEEVFRKIIALI